MIVSHSRKPCALYASHHKEASIIPKRTSETGCFKHQVSNIQFCKHLLKSRDIPPTQVLRSLRSNQMGETSILEFYVLPKEFLAFCYVDNSPKALWVKVPYHRQQLNGAAWLWALSHPSLRAFLLPSMAHIRHCCCTNEFAEQHRRGSDEAFTGFPQVPLELWALS